MFSIICNNIGKPEGSYSQRNNFLNKHLLHSFFNIYNFLIHDSKILTASEPITNYTLNTLLLNIFLDFIVFLP